MTDEIKVKMWRREDVEKVKEKHLDDQDAFLYAAVDKKGENYLTGWTDSQIGPRRVQCNAMRDDNTRCQGIEPSAAARMAQPTPTGVRRLSINSESWPYVTTRPGGTRLTIFHTRSNGLSVSPGLVDVPFVVLLFRVVIARCFATLAALWLCRGEHVQ